MTSEPADDSVVHAYGVVPGGRAVALPEHGIDGAGVALLDAGPVAAVFSRLPVTAYGEEAWQTHAEDPHWLAHVATEHADVLAKMIEDTDVLPLRLPSMHRDEEHLHQMLTAESALLEGALGAIHDHVEWGVKVFLAGAPSTPSQERPASGREYLRRRADEAAERERARADRTTLVSEAYAALAELARQSVTNQPQDPALSGRRETMLLNSAHLVSRRHRDLFFAAVDSVADRLSPAGLTVEVSGPWPPYNFVDLGAEPREARR